MRIAVIGLGKLGLCTAACFASAGNTVYAFDANKAVRDALLAKRCPINEPGLEQLLRKSAKKLIITASIEDAVLRSQMCLIIVPTPSGKDGRFDNSFVESAIKNIVGALKNKKGFYVVDVVSTVMPGSCDTVFKPLLEKLSGKRCGKDFGLVYNPEFIALGSVIRDFMHPDMVLIGSSDEKSARTAMVAYKTLFKKQPHYACMALIDAEIAKLSLNCFVTMKISFANEIAALCEKIPGADIDAVTAALGQDTRIGGKYLKAGLGFGGTCFPRDNVAFIALAKEFGYDPSLAPAVVAVNHNIVTRIAEIINSSIKSGLKISILGLSYKPGTCIVEESQSVMVARLLARQGYEVCVHDPKALDTARAVLAGSVKYALDPYQCCGDAAAVLVMTAWPQYRQLDWACIDAEIAGNCIIVDCWRLIDSSQFTRGEYIGFGQCKRKG